MGKKQSSNIYETEQANKRHRHKSKKLEKREKHKKNKKKNKQEKNKKRKIEKYIKKGFKENKQHIDITKLFGECLNLDEILKNTKRILELNQEAVGEVPELFKLMEEKKKEINISGIEDKTSQKHILKLFKNLKISQNPKNPFCFRITNLNKKRDIKIKYTTDIDDIISDSLDSYYLLVKLIFEYVNYIINNPNDDEDMHKEEDKNNEDKDSINDDEEEVEGDSHNSDGDEEIDRRRLKEFDKEKMEMDYEYDLMEEKLGKNAELINKAFNKIMQEDYTNKNNKRDDEEEELVGPPIPKFLEATMSLINTDEDKESFNKVLQVKTYSNKKHVVPVSASSQKSGGEFINKESYDRLINYERERMKNMSDQIEDYESKYRGTSLLEEYQQMKKKNNDLSQGRGFDRDRDMNIGRIDSKRALSIMRDSKGLKGRFEAKEKYIGY